MKNSIFGKINSFQTLGTLDGPGVRFVVFMQGCPLHCVCCHNPETLDKNGGIEMSAEAVFEKMIRYKEYFSSNGGITLTGGEPLLQPEFCAALFKICKGNGINTCLDTSGFALNDSIKNVLEYTDYCMLDIKYTNDEYYKKYVGCSFASPLSFLDYLNEKNIPTRIRQVIIKDLNNNAENIKNLANLKKAHPCVCEVELLPFRKLCIEKYKKLNLEFPLANVPETEKSETDSLYSLLENF